jgi:hypothetical protein
MLRRFVAFALVIALVLFAAARPAATQPTITGLGSLPGGSDSCGFGVSAAKRCVVEDVAAFSISVRVHQTINYLSTDQFESDHTAAVAV